MGLVDDRRADRQGDPVPAADHARRAAAGRPHALALARGIARLRPYRRLRASARGRRSTGRSGSPSSRSLAFSTSVVDVAAILGPTTPAPLAVRLTEWMNDPDLSMRFLASAGALLQLARHRRGAADLDRPRACLALAARQFRGAGRRFRHDRVARPSCAGARCCLSALPVFGGLAMLACGRSPGCGNFPTRCRPRSPRDLDERRATHRRAARRPRCSLPRCRRRSPLFSTLLCLLRENETGRTAGRGALALDLSAADRAAGRLPVRPAAAVHSSAARWPPAVAGSRASGLRAALCVPVAFRPLARLSTAATRRSPPASARAGWTTLCRVRTADAAARHPDGGGGRLRRIDRPISADAARSGRAGSTTITTEAVALASGGNRRVIGVYAFLQMVLPALGFLVATAVPALIFRNRRAMRVLNRRIRWQREQALFLDQVSISLGGRAARRADAPRRAGRSADGHGAVRLGQVDAARLSSAAFSTALSRRQAR